VINSATATNIGTETPSEPASILAK
jgi:hypothetical protein